MSIQGSEGKQTRFIIRLKQMPQMIKRGNELIRINPQRNILEFSTSNGLNWNSCFTDSMCGTFYDLMDNGKEILAQTSRGLWFSTSEGRNWNKRS